MVLISNNYRDDGNDDYNDKEEENKNENVYNLMTEENVNKPREGEEKNLFENDDGVKDRYLSNSVGRVVAVSPKDSNVDWQHNERVRWLCSLIYQANFAFHVSRHDSFL